MRTLPSAARSRVYGLTGIIVVGLIVAFGVASYLQVFTPVVTVSLESDRSGLLMDRGGEVRLHGVRVGEVRSVRPVPEGGAELELAIDADQAGSIPENVTAEIRASTVFGPKSVLLVEPPRPSTSHIEAGDVLRTRRMTVEINDVFATLNDVLLTVEPAKLNASLGAVATSLRGRGQEMGEYVEQLNAYLEDFNPYLPTLDRDLASGADVLGTYRAAAPDLLELTRNATRTSRTLTETQVALDAVLLDFTRTSLRARDFVDRAEEPMMLLLNHLRPVTRLLAEYSPEYTCGIQAMNKARIGAEMATAGQVSSLQMKVAILPAQKHYVYPRDLPKIVTGLGPDCYQLPTVTKAEQPSPRYIFADGTTVFDGRSDAVEVGNPPVELYTALFGEAAGQALRERESRGGAR